MAVTEESNNFLMIDEDYEFSAPKFFDFIEGETEEEMIKAQLWFDSALSYAPSRMSIHFSISSNFLSSLRLLYNDYVELQLD